MKKLITIAALLVISTSISAQVPKYILTSGTNGYVTVTQPNTFPQDYTRGTLIAQFSVPVTGDTVMSLLFTNGYSFTPFTLPINDTNFQDGDLLGTPNFPTYDSLQRWVHSHLNKYVGN